MIEAVSFPPDLSTWHPGVQPFYLEFYGETSPQVDVKYAEVLSKGGQTPTSTDAIPVYEYWWTLGHLDGSIYWPTHDDITKPVQDGDAGWWEDFRPNIAARVIVEFPISGGWRPREIVATVKYLSPVAQQHAWWNEVGRDLKLLDPELMAASQLAGLVPGGTGVSKVLKTISKLEMASVPQTGSFPWSVEKITSGGDGDAVTQGVMWNLPASLMKAQGGRVTGSVAVALLPAAYQQNETPAKIAALEARPIKAHARLFPKEGPSIRIPGGQGASIDLYVEPSVSSS